MYFLIALKIEKRILEYDNFKVNKQFYFQAVQVLTRELRFIENEFHYVKGDEERERVGQSLKFVGRRLLELVDELIEIINAKGWRSDNSFYLGLNKDESVSMTIKLATATAK